MTIQNIIDSIKTEKTRSAWDRGVMAYALDLLEELEDNARNGYFDEEYLYSAAMLNEAGVAQEGVSPLLLPQYARHER